MGKSAIKEGDWVKVPGGYDNIYQVVICQWGMVKVRRASTFLFFKEDEVEKI